MRNLDPQVPEPLADLIRQLLARDVEDRPKDAEEVVSPPRHDDPGRCPGRDGAAARGLSASQKERTNRRRSRT